MSGWIKRLRQKIRRRRSALVLASILIFLLTLSIVWVQDNSIDHANSGEEAQEALAPRKWQVIIQKNYVAGPMIEEEQEYSAAEIDQLLATFSHMNMVKRGDDFILFTMQIDDISPIIKENGYFALDHHGMLHLYRGDIRDENIIQTFFQIDMERLETTLPLEEYMQLREGIHISSLAEYNRILSTYSEFAVLLQEDNEVEER